MAYKVNYAGIDLDRYFTILNVGRTLMPPRDNFTKDIPGIHGKIYTGYKYTEKEIKLECLLKAGSAEEYVDILREISFILDVNSPKRLIINDSPGKYCYAVPEGEIAPDKTLHNGKFELKFVCYDPITYALEEDFFFGDSNKKISINNAGTTSAYPKLSVSFNDTAHFLQCTNYNGETVLIGAPPSVDKPNTDFDPVVLNDNCQTLQGWNSIGNIVDNAIVDGSLTINGGGYGIMCNNFGSGDQWHGAGGRKNFTPVSDFKVEVKLEHNSQGDLRGTGAGANPPATSGGSGTSVKYKITANPSLRIRQGRSTSTAQIGSIPQGKVVDVSDIQNNWGYTTYNGVSGYIYMEHTQKYVESSSSNTSSKYKCTADPSLRIRSGRGTNYKQVGSIRKGATVTVTDIQSNWGYVNINGVKGYVSMQYMTKVNSTRSLQPFADEDSDKETAEDRLGKVEVYGFDVNGVKLFKMSMRDTSEWYEYSEPEIQIGNSVVLDDNKTVPSPKTITTKDDQDENKTVTKKIDSGKYGDWNEFSGWFTVQRKTNAGGQQEWFCKVEKLNSSGSVERSIYTNTLVNNLYPKGALSNIVIFFGKYSQVIPVDVMNVNEIKVTNIGTPPKPAENKPIFKKGDELLIDFSEQKAYLNSRDFMNKIDIGSQFFTIPVGNSQVICKSDDNNINVEMSIQKRWI